MPPGVVGKEWAKKNYYYLIGAGGTNLMREQVNGGLEFFWLDGHGQWVSDNSLHDYTYGGSSSSADTEFISRDRAVIEAARLCPGVQVDLP